MANMLPFQILISTIHGKTLKSLIKLNSYCQEQHRVKNLNDLMDHILLQIIKVILSISSKNKTHLLLTHQSETRSTRLEIELHLKCIQDIILRL